MLISWPSSGHLRYSLVTLGALGNTFLISECCFLVKEQIIPASPHCRLICVLLKTCGYQYQPRPKNTRFLLIAMSVKSTNGVFLSVFICCCFFFINLLGDQVACHDNKSNMSTFVFLFIFSNKQTKIDPPAIML